MSAGRAPLAGILEQFARPLHQVLELGLGILMSAGRAPPCRDPRAARVPAASSARARPRYGAEPTCAMIRRRPTTDTAICTAVAPDAVRTRRIHATEPTARHRLVLQKRPPRPPSPQDNELSTNDRGRGDQIEDGCAQVSTELQPHRTASGQTRPRMPDAHSCLLVLFRC